jgi:alpha-beta hydrolase superfamily lysophospholipase
MHSSYLAFLPSDLVPSQLPRPTSTWWNRGDIDLHIERIVQPGADVRMLLVHGGGGHAAALWPFAVLAAEHGFDVVVPDLPGYGRTHVRPGRRIDYSDWVDCLTDLIRVELDNDPRPLVVFGASMGGMLAYDAVGRSGRAAALVATCLLDPRSPTVRAAITRYRWLGRVGPSLLGSALDRVRVPMRWIAKMGAMSNVPELVRLVVSDPYGGRVSMPLGFLRTFLTSQPGIEPEKFTACPVWLVHPGADAWTPLPLSESFFERIAAPKTQVTLDNAGHYPVEAPGIYQLVNALDDIREEVRARHIDLC